MKAAQKGIKLVPPARSALLDNPESIRTGLVDRDVGETLSNIAAVADLLNDYHCRSAVNSEESGKNGLILLTMMIKRACEIQSDQLHAVQFGDGANG